MVQVKILLHYDTNSKEKLVKLLDKIGYLPALMLQKEDKNDFFEQYSKGICEEYEFHHMIKKI